MSFEDPWFREGQTKSPLDWERRMFEQTGNPLHVWRAYEICSELMRGGVFHSDSLPSWVLDYFDTVLDAIRELYYENYDGKVTATEMGARLMEALKIKAAGQGVRSTAFSKDRLRVLATIRLMAASVPYTAPR
jgi:hypothetical protein